MTTINMKTLYTARLQFKNQGYMKSHANDLYSLIKQSIFLLDNNNDYLQGLIVDNNTGEIIHKNQKIKF